MNQTGDLIRRRRECPRREGRFTTYERVEEVMPAVIKKDGRREAFAREKIFQGLQKACEKRPVTTNQLEEITTDIQRRISGFGVKEIPTKTIGQMVMAALHRLDKVAYIRFASVYREFNDVQGFVAELKEIPQDVTDQDNLSFPFVAPEA
jgi:transcriptional repressor NrdR